MKIFSRIKSKVFHGNGNTIKPEPNYVHQDNPMRKCCEEEFLCYPNSFLAIGTLGGNLKDSGEGHRENTKSEEFEEVKKELKISLLDKHDTLHSNFPGELNQQCISSTKKLSAEQNIADVFITNDSKNVRLQRMSSVAHGKDTPSDNRGNGMYKRSSSFLLKRVLLYRGGLLPGCITSPVLKDTFPNPKANNSRMEKMLKAMLRKKKNHQRHKYLDTETEKGAAMHGNWVKTDSEYIVLEL